MKNYYLFEITMKPENINTSNPTNETWVRKNIVKNLPKPIAEFAKIAKRLTLLLINSGYDYWRYSKYSSSVFRGNSEDKLRALITIHYHSIEKGLSLKNPRPGFGVAAINTLLEHMDEYLKRYGPAEHLSIPLNALKCYLDFNLKNGIDNNTLKNKVDTLEARYISSLGTLHNGGGVIKVSRNQILDAVKGVGADFFNLRHSIRHFSEEDISLDTISEAVQRAQKTPAVCNRQSGKAWVVSGSESIEKVLTIQKGARGFSDGINKLIIVTSDLCNFQSTGERYQSWIDGGLFSMSLIYALHSLGLGTCCLNWSMEFQQDMKLKTFLKIPQSETIIMIIAVGALPSELLVAESCRKNLNEALVMIQ